MGLTFTNVRISNPRHPLMRELAPMRMMLAGKRRR
jgi:hypothetical protein